MRDGMVRRGMDRLYWLRGIVASLALSMCVLGQWWLGGQMRFTRAIGFTEYPYPLLRIEQAGDAIAHAAAVGLLGLGLAAAAAGLACRRARTRLGTLLAWIGACLLCGAAGYYCFGAWCLHHLWDPPGGLSS